MPKIVVTPELLDEKAGQVSNIKTEYDQAIQKLTTLVNGLTDIWQGDAQKAFQARFDGMKQTFTDFGTMLDDYSKDLKTAANRYREAEIEVGNHVGS